MTNSKEKPEIETKRIEKLKTEEARILAKEQAMTQAYLAREQEIEKAQKTKEDQRARDRVDEDSRELAKEKARKEAYQAREKKLAEDQEARRLKNK